MAVLKDLIVHGRSRFLNGAQFNTINAESIGATEGVFNKLIATTLDAKTATIDDLTAQNATVIGLLDVKGQLHTNSWTNSNIATIDGAFFITPTVSVKQGSFTYTLDSNINSGRGQITITGVSPYTFGVDNDWQAGSLVMLTGQVASGEAKKPLGTIRGILSSATAETIVINGPFSDSDGNDCTTLEEIGTVTGADGDTLKVSLYQKSISNSFAPLGIYMTSGGTSTQNTSFIDIYNGGNLISTANQYPGAFAKPVVRIGNLNGFPALGGRTPTGYGIYTTNGYFEGSIVATTGVISDSVTIGDTGQSITQTINSVTDGVIEFTTDYVIENNVATFTAHVYKQKIDITITQYQPEQFTWYYKKLDDYTEHAILNNTDSDNNACNWGYTISVNLDDIGYGGVVVGRMTFASDVEGTSNNSILGDSNGNPLTETTSNTNVTRIRDLTYTTNISSTDKLLLVTSEEEKLISINALTITEPEYRLATSTNSRFVTPALLKDAIDYHTSQKTEVQLVRWL